MKILCLGRKGNNRSVALAGILKLKGHDAIAVGMRCMGRDTRKMMLDWADKIILLHNKCIEGVPRDYHGKLTKFHVSCVEKMPTFDVAVVSLIEGFVGKEGL